MSIFCRNNNNSSSSEQNHCQFLPCCAGWVAIRIDKLATHRTLEKQLEQTSPLLPWWMKGREREKQLNNKTFYSIGKSISIIKAIHSPSQTHAWTVSSGVDSWHYDEFMRKFSLSENWTLSIPIGLLCCVIFTSFWSRHYFRRRKK